ncbi:transglutaminaseTgpA domain-containing protein [Streptomyces sp. NPDC059176]|uniref:transglutaminase TgpA family protein n=1 Tax=unclassified Streptomyces TaxID=2593676 RepID=UPI0036A628B7
MSGRGRLAVCAFAASMMAAAALVPLVAPSTWFLQAAFMVALVSGAGALARRVPLARPLTVVAQGVLVLLMLTLVFARDEALLWLFPGPRAFARFGDLLSSGTGDVGQYAIPAPATEGIQLMLVGGVLMIALTVDALAVTYRSAAPAGLPLLALYSVAAGLSGGGSGWLWFLLAASGYLLLLLAEGRDRLSQWGRVFGSAPSTGGGLTTDNGAARAPVRTGRRIGAVALGVALVVPTVLPALGGGLLNGTGNGPGDGPGGGVINAVNPVVTLQDNLNQAESREWLQYKTNAETTSNMYLRIMALDQFDGGAWKFSQRKLQGVPEQFPRPEGLADGVSTTEIRTNISAADSYEQGWLPMPYPATKVSIEGDWRFDRDRRTILGDHGQTTGGVQYSVTSLLVNPTAEQLARAPKAPASVLEEYTKVPDAIPVDVLETARQVTKGASSDYERAVRLQDWFAVKGGFTYDTDVESGGGLLGISRFLKSKEGFCIHFSFSMAAMARTLGIPARVAVGFTPGKPVSDGAMSVSNQDAHAWPELYFEGVGWTRFEPTPTRGSAPEYTRPQAPSGAPSTPAAPEPSASVAAPAVPPASQSCSPQNRKLGECGAAAPQDVDPSSDEGSAIGAILLWAAAGAAALLVPLLPMLWRQRVRARRLGAGGRTPEEAAVRTMAAWQEIIDTAWDHGMPPDGSQTPRKTAARIVREGRLEGEPADAVHRAARAVEQVLYAPDPHPGSGLTDDVARFREGLAAAGGRRARLRARFLPRSTVQAVWTVSERWNALFGRWTAARLRLVERTTAQLRRPSRQRG